MRERKLGGGVTAEELLSWMWKNCFRSKEETQYKFCMRSRIESSQIAELDWFKVKRKSFLRDYRLTFGAGLVMFKAFTF